MFAHSRTFDTPRRYAAAALTLLLLVASLAFVGFAPTQAHAASDGTKSSVEATLGSEFDIALLSSSSDTSSVTGVLLGQGVTAYRSATIDQAAVYNAALKQVIKWRQDALDDTNVKWEYSGTYYTMKEYLSKAGISQSDYLNPKWSNALERIAVQRAAEAWSSSLGHTRPYSSTTDSQTAFTATYKGIQSWGEILAWTSGDTAYAIDLWASEKSDYLKEINGEDHGVTGHYTQLIDPSRKYYGFGHVGRTYAGESGYSLSSGDSTTPTNWSGSKTFEVALSEDKVNEGTTWSSSSTEETMVKGSSKTYSTELSYGSGVFFLKNGTWKSSNTSVATVDQSGKVTAVADGAATITYTASNHTFTLKLTVGQADISKASVTLSPKSYSYTGSACTPTPTVTFNGATLTQGTDYTVAYSNNVNAGTATATITGKGDYKGTASATFTISPVSFSTSTTGLKLNKYSYEWTGSAITPEPVVTYTSNGVTKTLTKGTDYTVSYSNNTDIGSYTARTIITGKGNFSSYASMYITFSITKATPTYTLPTGLTATYGDTLASVTLPSGFAWSNSSASVGSAGTHTFMATYTPSDTTHYKTVSNISVGVQVQPKQITQDMFTVNTSAATYTGSAITKSVSSTIGSSNYEVSYKNNTNAGTATITVAGKNNYTGTLEYTFTISPASLASANVALDSTAFIYDGMAKKPSATVSLGGKTLSGGSDYTMAYSSNVNAGTATATVTGAGNYTGSVSKTFTINKATLTATYAGETISYGATPAAKVNVTGFVNGETALTAAGYVAPTVAAPASLEVGKTYTLTPAGGAAANYNFTYVAGALKVTAADISNTAVVTLAAESFTYTGQAQTPAVTVRLGSGEVLDAGSYAVAYANNVSAGTATATVSFKGNYTGSVSKAFTINKATLTATYVSESIVEYSTPALKVDVTGFVNGETALTAAGYVAPTVAAPASLEVGKTYTLTPADGAAANYSFTYVAGTLEVASHVHDYQLQSKTDATCTQAGTATYKCSICGEVKTETTPALGHEVVTDAAVAATCTTPGLTEGSHCSRCNEVLVAQKEVPALSHDYVTTPGKPATCTEDGATEGIVCSRCGDVKEGATPIPALGHDWGEWVVTKEATRADAGEETRTCQREGCGATETREIPKLAATISRVAGDEANQTAAAISASAFEQSDWAILAREDDFADAMSSTGLAGVLNAPIILTDRTALSPAAAAEIQRLGVKNVYIIGGTGAMPGNFEGQLTSLGVTSVERVFGNEYYDTSVECANKLAAHGGATTATIVSYGQNFQDALSISSYAYKYHLPILLETTGATSAERTLSAEAQALLESGAYASAAIYVPGGPGAVSTASVEGTFGSLRGGQRIYGETGYDTSNALAVYFTGTGELSASTACIATGAEAAKGVDALAGAALAGKNGGVMLLASAQPGMEAENYATIQGGDHEGNASFLEANASAVQSCYILGGTYVLPDAFKLKVEGLLAA